jgi:hypothetical protein
LSACVPAVVALVDGRVFGCLAGLYWERAGMRNVFCPEWANACIGDQARFVREEPYAWFAERWLADREGHRRAARRLTSAAIVRECGLAPIAYLRRPSASLEPILVRDR